MERSSPSRTAGVCVREVTIGGVVYTLSVADKVRRAADEEAVVISRRQMPQGLASEDRMLAMNVMVCGIASPEEWANYRRSLWHIAFRFWNAMDPAAKKQHAGTEGKTPAEMLKGVKWAYELFSDEDRTGDEFDATWDAIGMVSQEELVKNSSGSPEAGTP